MKPFLLISALTLVASGLAQSGIDPARAARYFQEAKWASDDDAGKLWGKVLYGPTLFVDPATRTLVANQADTQGKLQRHGDVWTGTLPQEIPLANTATNWSGVRWSMVIWDELDNPTAIRIQLIMHESWHRIQADLGLPMDQPANRHLDTMEGRIWLRLEWRALTAALLSFDDRRRQAIEDALLFRANRRRLFPNAAKEEDRMELNEGLAEYTGVALMGLGEWSRGAYVAGRVTRDAVTRPSYPLSFAYDTGPSYGILLDGVSKNWRKSLTVGSSLSAQLETLEKIRLPANLAFSAKVRAAAYDGPALVVEEKKREDKRQIGLAKWTRQLVSGPTLELPLIQGNVSFDPNEAFPLEDRGTVFQHFHLAEDWGVIEVSNGALFTADRKHLIVSAPKSATDLLSSNWVLTLNRGYRLVPGKRAGDYSIAPAP